MKLDDFLKFTKDLGLNKIELRNDLPGGKIIDGYTPGQLKELSKKYGVEILTINALQKFNLAAILPETIQELKKLINLSLSIGCKAIVLCPNNDVNDKRNSEEIFKETVKALTQLHHNPPKYSKNTLLRRHKPLQDKEIRIQI